MAAKQTALFGGAISISLPRRFSDVSALRQIPDNQEVFVDVDTDQSIVVELLSLEESVEDGGAAKFHFGSIAHDNEAASAEIEAGPAPAETPHIADSTTTVCHGTQMVSKFKEGAECSNAVQVYVASVRLRKVDTDMVISLNWPVAVNAQSSSAETVAAEAVQAATVAHGTHAPSEFLAIVASANIQDYSLFG